MAGSSSEQKPSITGRLVLVLGALLFLHAAYSTYEHLALRKSLGLAVDTSDAVSFDIKVETLVGLVVVLLGTCLTASPLREVTWASEWRKRTIDEVDARPSFVTFNHRGPLLFSTAETAEVATK